MESSEGNQIFGRIYKITSSDTDDVYVGSTLLTLNRRFSNHKNHYKRYAQGIYDHRYTKSFEIIKFGDARIELVSEGLFNTKSRPPKIRRWIYTSNK